jgi:hypothetical protein
MYKCYVSVYYPSSCFYLEYCPLYISKHNVSEARFCVRPQVKLLSLAQLIELVIWLAFSLCIWEVPGSSLALAVQTKVYVALLRTLAKARIVYQIRS